MSISIAIVEDEKNYNNALKKVINYQKDMKVVGQFFDGNDALKNLPDLSPNVVMMDIQLQDMLGIEIIEKLKKEMPETHFIMCTSFEDDEKIFNSLKAGAMGYLVKGESMDKILSSIRDVYSGGAPMSFSIARRVLQHFEKKLPEIKGFDELTKREQEILELLSQGFLYKEIADQKCISMDTVKKHVGNIYRKLHVSNKVEAINKFNHFKN
ncbi:MULTISPECIES: response regulator transcription factor [Chryseobacterium]|uniref:DNA-binding response regulator n=1 Tax=Chryseobacterium bernardetii TaxID=1241978 RepID=A0A3G6U0W7_9FLAO|nr:MULTISPECIES: response regulator transcription factor [Chryseobacterium]AZB24551.1 DNA-binding response regulator [Chryseobacterium bernardetii]AZB35135.1 DNA-binding response regulator [Chryseobacterium bernardetii]UCA58972.1 response regulator transcription factor [Chryseobacterium rhizoplanae]